MALAKWCGGSKAVPDGPLVVVDFTTFSIVLPAQGQGLKDDTKGAARPWRGIDHAQVVEGSAEEVLCANTAPAEFASSGTRCSLRAYVGADQVTVR